MGTYSVKSFMSVSLRRLFASVVPRASQIPMACIATLPIIFITTTSVSSLKCGSLSIASKTIRTWRLLLPRGTHKAVCAGPFAPLSPISLNRGSEPTTCTTLHVAKAAAAKPCPARSAGAALLGMLSVQVCALPPPSSSMYVHMLPWSTTQRRAPEQPSNEVSSKRRRSKTVLWSRKWTISSAARSTNGQRWLMCHSVWNSRPRPAMQSLRMASVKTRELCRKPWGSLPCVCVTCVMKSATASSCLYLTGTDSL
mmetsp:Transcript_5659/g.13236  ORF Transcript_5659/g.13236 Transcript_5659/m.13236 type:complete len:254 (+) Transcript_5659:536-1297(+)